MVKMFLNIFKKIVSTKLDYITKYIVLETFLSLTHFLSERKNKQFTQIPGIYLLCLVSSETVGYNGI